MRRSATVVLVICAAVLGLLPAGAAAATSAPAWTIEAVPYPSAFEAGTVDGVPSINGPAYLIQAYNIGGEATSGDFTVTDTLPKGLLPVPAFPATGGYGRGPIHPFEMSCSAAGRKVTCTGGSEGPVGPGEAVSVVVPVKVEAGAKGILANTVTVESATAKAEATTPTPVSASPSPFAFIEGPGLYGSATNADGSEATLAASHPYQLSVAGMNLKINQSGPNLRGAGGGLREATVELPAGTVVDPQAAAQCKESELEKAAIGCPAASQVGTVALTLSLAENLGQGAAILPLYNMVPPPGSPAELGFEVIGGSYAHLLGAVRSDGSFTLTASGKDVLARVPVLGVRATLWGEPSAAAHDNQRGECIANEKLPACATPRTRQAFVTMPAACGPAPQTIAHIASWLGEEDSASYGAPRTIEGCDSVAFEPSITAKPTTASGDSPSGLEFDLRQAQSSEYENETGGPVRGKAPLKDATVTLPVGMALNPAAGDGLEACTPDQAGLTTAPGQTPVRWREEPAHCPPASKVGTASVSTPLLGHELAGSVYLARPFDNPFGSLLGLYLVIEDEATGIIAKLAGRVQADPTTGQLTTTFSENPQLPLADVHLSLFDGARAALTTPLTCGTKTTTGQLTPWSSPTPTTVADSFEVASAPGGGACPGSEAQAPDTPAMSAGTTDPLAGAYSPFVLRLTRADGTQRIAAIDTTLPAGLTGKLAGIPYCSEAQIAAARARSHPEEGKLEIQSPSCPAASEVGTATVGAGSGPSPIFVTGHAYLAGPYKGAPLSMVIITPAVAGPFDLGVVVVRVALQVDLETARIHAVSDPLPTILEGIPLDVRSIALELGRPGFTLNPTSCTRKAIEATVTSPAGQSVKLSEPFGVEGCQKLKFRPRLKLSLKGPTRRTGHPALKAVVTTPKKGTYANTARIQVGLPHSEFLDQGNLNKVCTQPQLRSATCPKGSVYGHVKVWTPLFEKPLEGNVYIGVGYGHKLPDLVTELNGQVRVLLHGRVDTTKAHGLRNTFEYVPDAPFSRVVLQLKGGKKYGLLENSQNICRKTQRASARFTGQNGIVAQLHPVVANSCKKAKKKGGKGKKKGGGGKH